MSATLRAMVPGFVPQGTTRANLRLVPQETARELPEQSFTQETGSRAGLSQEQGHQVARQLLDEGGQLALADWQFQQERGPVELQLTPLGEQRVLMRGMTNMAEDMFQQHTGTTGESYDKLALGQMLSSLKGPAAATPFVPRRGSAWQAAAAV